MQRVQQDALAVAATTVQHVEQVLVWFQQRGCEHASQILGAVAVGRDEMQESARLRHQFVGVVNVHEHLEGIGEQRIRGR